MDVVKEIVEMAKRRMLETGYHPPVVFVKGSEEKLIVEMQTFGNTNAQRVQDMYEAGIQTALGNDLGELELIVLVNETWMNSNPDVRPSQDPNRKEMLMINTLDARTQEQDMQGFEVIRDPKGRLVNLIDWHHPASRSVKGNLLLAFLRGYQIVSPVLN